MNRLSYGCLSALCLFIFSIAFSACSKKKEIQTVSTYTFINTLDEEVTIDVYDNQSDYYKSVNTIRTLKIPGDGSLPVEFEALRVYWLDWYTADYKFNNWASSSQGTQAFAAFPIPMLNIAALNDKIWIGSNAPDLSRSVLLNGNEHFSSWRLDIGVIPALNGTHIFTFRRDYTGEHRFTSQSGNTTVAPFKFLMTQISMTTFRMNVLKGMSGEEGLLADVYFNSNSGSTPNFVKDSIMIAFRKPTNTGYNIARRQ